ncbi:endocuticle structural glycoprotein SgAbd-1 [Orussus abietinus]|uniref:endocuticle structural glycoprotein SgAbd-1 n=1 Tax=Orussus abietinus TaxID=222816 RepID=UPI000625C727|nr:endocuticle structural glycoprotein SgAbd-1 [Orussus abietinus]
MKFIIASLALVAAVSGQLLQVQPGHETKPVAILRQAQDIAPEGTYSFSYETENGIFASESGEPQPVGPDGTPAVVARGQFHYTSPDGTPIAVSYTADENGFHPEGEHLPVAPPIPEDIQRSLVFNAAHPEPEETQPKYGRTF